MKSFLAAVVLATAALLVYGTPLNVEKPVIAHRWQSPDPILPMTFAHEDHAAENCVQCHHNYVDGTGGTPCMYCHVTNEEIYPLLEAQFHELCRDCHEKKQRLGEAGGPTRRCIDCHLDEDLP